MKLSAVFASAFTFASALAFASAQASPIDVSYTVTGSSGNWLYDFSVTNNLGGTLDIYAVNFTLSDAYYAGSPIGWVPSTVAIPAAALQWCDTSCSLIGGVPPNQTVSGFSARGISIVALASVQWTIEAIDPTQYYFECLFSSCFPVYYGYQQFNGVASESVLTPLPAALPLFATGLGALGLLGWRRKRKDAAALAAA